MAKTERKPPEAQRRRVLEAMADGAYLFMFEPPKRVAYLLKGSGSKRLPLDLFDSLRRARLVILEEIDNGVREYVLSPAGRAAIGRTET